MQDLADNSAEWMQFIEWRASKASRVDKSFWELEKILNRAVKIGFDETMPCDAFRVLANALIALKDEFNGFAKQ